jgi:hypothetical protein
MTPVSALSRMLPMALRPAVKRAYHRVLPPSRRRAGYAAGFRSQATWCRRLGAPMSGGLLERAAQDIERSGPLWDLLADRPPPPPGTDEALAARVLAGVHRLVLEGRLPELARFYPSVGGDAGGDPFPAFRAAVAEHAGFLRGQLDRPVQTNEVSRSSALIGGYLLVARETGLPLRLLETGASAGLNLRWTEYRYEEQGLAWGDAASPVRLTGAFTDGRPPFGVQAQVAERRGCDLAPIDPTTEDGRLTLMSFAWAEERWRVDLLRAACDIATRLPVQIDRADACDWVERHLHPEPGAATVLVHSIFRMYLPDAAKARFDRAVEAAGASATAQAPLAWLRMEWDVDRVLVHLTTWPGGETRLLAHTDHRGRNVRWLAS